MAKRFCSACETFHEGPCSAAALARASSKGSKKRKSIAPVAGSWTLRDLETANTSPPLTADVPAGAVRKLGDLLTSKAATDLEKALNLPSAEDGWKSRYEALLAKIEAEKQSNRERVQKHRAAKAKKKKRK